LTPKVFARRLVAEQWPILVVGAMVLLAFVLVIGGYWRRGALVLAIGVGMAAAMRLTLTDERAGLLVVRTRLIDVLTTASCSAVMFYIAWTINPLGTS